ncbi:hypothetical protein WICMUC_005395 [Wickerhamomyces mucosus]|uniref:LicD/FKTN/FKRP nucleotidyltransferase domain-containing protein n=1 Tax=Wickerhamomyces mucosus TaxID=1378264 RepID=A0A9P8P7M4_9ASCO|nr:hypothetical protein WICMUC_005395 [Wickerhamomyces mucosus]
MRNLTPSIIISIILAWIFLKSRSKFEETDKELTTIPYSRSDINLLKIIDSLSEDNYDPRRFGVSALEYLKNEAQDADAIPFDWRDVVDWQNKTQLGLLWLENYPVKEICLMKRNKFIFEPTKSGNLPLINNTFSIKDTIHGFFLSVESISEIHTYKSIELSSHDFKLNFTQNIESLSENQKQILLCQIKAEEYRYFKEGSLLSNTSNGLAHYDLRFYNYRIKPVDRIAILHRIVRAWSRFTISQNIETWLMHGSLMGYYFNGLILPWDDDIDVQLSSKSFWKLIKYNNTLVIDYEDEVNLGKYLIDINPFFYKRARSAENKIDARFIDVESGLYIDITILTSEMNQMMLLQSLDEKETIEFFKVFDPYYDLVLTETLPYQTSIDFKINQTINASSLLSCKDFHFYTVEELSPLIPTIFEGEVLYAPNNIEKLLLREYNRKSLYLTKFRDFEFNKIKHLWRSNIVEYEFNTILRDFISFHYHSIKQSTNMKRHSFNISELIKFPAFRVEPWIRQVQVGFDI